MVRVRFTSVGSTRLAGLSLTLFLFLFSTATSTAADYSKLLNQKSRPSVLELKKTLNPWPRQNPFPRPLNQAPGYIDDLSDKIPAALAAFEKAYPGATFAYLGRDSSWLYDVALAFYDGLGEPERVVMLPMSRNSMTGKDKDLLDFAKTYGLNADRLKRPFIMIDRSTWRPGQSQLREILRVAYEDYASRHGDARKLLPLVNGISIGHTLNNPIQRIDTKKFLKNFMGAPLQREPEEILSYNVGQVGWNNLGQNTEWHDAFLQFRRSEDGKIYGRPGALESVQNRNQILSEMYEIVEKVQTQKFVDLVGKKAQALGYDWRPKIGNPKFGVPEQKVEELEPEKPKARPEPQKPVVKQDQNDDYRKKTAENVLRDIRRGDDSAKRKARRIFKEWMKDKATRALLLSDFGDSKRLAHIIEEIAPRLDKEILRDYVNTVRNLGKPAEAAHERAVQTCKHYLKNM